MAVKSLYRDDTFFLASFPLLSHTSSEINDNLSIIFRKKLYLVFTMLFYKTCFGRLNAMVMTAISPSICWTLFMCQSVCQVRVLTAAVHAHDAGGRLPCPCPEQNESGGDAPVPLGVTGAQRTPGKLPHAGQAASGAFSVHTDGWALMQTKALCSKCASS